MNIQLDRNKLHFNWALEHAYREAEYLNDSEAMAWANIAGNLTARLHPGFYMHPGLENMLKEIGSRHSSREYNYELGAVGKNPQRKHWIHVLTTAMPIGGHTRLVAKWILNQFPILPDVHSIVLVNQGGIQCPEWLLKAVETTGGSCINIPEKLDLVGKAMVLRAIAGRWADVVVLHISPSDPIASVAFGVNDGPPVVLMNHADHLFWFGSGVSDLVADFRPEGQHVSLSRRLVNGSEILPIPLRKPGLIPTRSECRRRLGIPENKRVLLSIGTSYKFQPFGELNFGKIILDLVKDRPDILFIVIGPSPSETAWKAIIEEAGGAIRVLGVINNVFEYYCAADLYIEGFPLGSGTASLDSALMGTPVLRAPMLLIPLLGINKYKGMNDTAVNMEEYRQQILNNLDDPGFLESASVEQKLEVEKCHVGEGWNAQLQHLISCVPSAHNSRTMADAAQNEGYLKVDELWAEIQAKQIAGSEEGWQERAVSLRASWGYLQKRKLVKELLLCLENQGFQVRQTKILELLKFAIVLFSPFPVVRWVNAGRRILGRWRRAQTPG